MGPNESDSAVVLQRQRKATFTLDEQGTLDGSVHELLTGHRAETWRMNNYQDWRRNAKNP